MWRRRGALSAVLAILVILLAPAPASAHAELLESTPANGERLTSAPNEVRLRFSEGVFLVPDGIRLLGPRGTLTGPDDVRTDGPDEVVLRVPRTLDAGLYTVLWRVVSEDSHPVRGALVFGIGDARFGTLPQPGAQEDPVTALSLVFGAFRWLGYAALALLAGGVVFLLLCWPEGWMNRRARRLLLLGWIGSTASATALLLLQGPNAAGRSLAGLLDPDLLGATLGTDYGWFVLARLGLLAFGGVILQGLLRNPRDRLLRSLTVLTLVVALPATWYGTGHANASPGLLTAVADIAHLSAMPAWLGGLAFLVCCASAFRSVAPTVRFSWIAATAVGVLTVTGLWRAWVGVGSLTALAGTAYGTLLVIKLAVIAGLLWLAALSRAAVRRWSRPGPPAESVRAARERHIVVRRQLAWSVRGEALFAVAVLAVTTLLVATPPATRPRPHDTAQSELAVGSGKVGVVLTPSRPGANTLTMRVRNTPVREVSAMLSLPERGVGPLKVRLVAKTGTRYESDGLILPMAGVWKVVLTIRTSDIDQETVETDVVVR
ncbi:MULTISPECIES: copper resistance protein CopC [unclassified Streptomyces]|uniref:copper resistance CopC/CopD family protein n=1 Tax=unclassified Streptomyces TaxID=2593676 RepID=UPI003405E785